jgi:adenosylcobinamide-GDP ribazoletransferase
MFRNFITALQFLTIVTVKRDHEPDESDLARSMVYFPFVGFLIGLTLVYADKVLLWLLPETLSNVFLIALSLVLTRALHADGLADSVDGLMGGRDRESRLAIMRDSRIGTAGALSLFIVLLVKYVCLNNLFADYKTAALLTAPAFGRWSQMLMMFHAEYGREEGMGRSFVGHVRVGGLVFASVISLGISAFVIADDNRTALLAAGIPIAVAVLTLCWRWFVIRRIGGVTGDVVGAANELNEALTLLLFVFFLAER